MQPAQGFNLAPVILLKYITRNKGQGVFLTLFIFQHHQLNLNI